MARLLEQGNYARNDRELHMIDPRMTKLAEVLVNYSTELKAGDKILIEAIDVPTEMTCELVRVARAAGADPLVTLKSNRVNRALMVESSKSQMDLIAETEALRIIDLHNLLQYNELRYENPFLPSPVPGVGGIDTLYPILFIGRIMKNFSNF